MKPVIHTDAELIDWFEKQEGAALVSDDFGHWACSGDGMQNVPEETPADIQTTFFIEKEKWRSSIREVILQFKRDGEEEKEEEEKE